MAATADEDLKSIGAESPAIHEVLAKLGTAAEAGRAYIFENHEREDDAPLWSHRFEWVAAGVLPQIDDPGMRATPTGRQPNLRRIRTKGDHAKDDSIVI